MIWTDYSNHFKSLGKTVTWNETKEVLITNYALFQCDIILFWSTVHISCFEFACNDSCWWNKNWISNRTKSVCFDIPIPILAIQKKRFFFANVSRLILYGNSLASTIIFIEDSREISKVYLNIDCSHTFRFILEIPLQWKFSVIKGKINLEIYRSRLMVINRD